MYFKHYNERNESRMVLIFSFWHPDLKQEERTAQEDQEIYFDVYGNQLFK